MQNDPISPDFLCSNNHWKMRTIIPIKNSFFIFFNVRSVLCFFRGILSPRGYVFDIFSFVWKNFSGRTVLQTFWTRMSLIFITFQIFLFKTKSTLSSCNININFKFRNSKNIYILYEFSTYISIILINFTTRTNSTTLAIFINFQPRFIANSTNWKPPQYTLSPAPYKSI